MKGSPGSWNGGEADIWENTDLKKRKYSHLGRRAALEDERSRSF